MVSATQKYEYDVWLNTLNNILYGNGIATPVAPGDGGAVVYFGSGLSPQQSAQAFMQEARLAEP